MSLGFLARQKGNHECGTPPSQSRAKRRRTPGNSKPECLGKQKGCRYIIEPSGFCRIPESRGAGPEKLDLRFETSDQRARTGWDSDGDNNPANPIAKLWWVNQIHELRPKQTQVNRSSPMGGRVRQAAPYVVQRHTIGWLFDSSERRSTNGQEIFLEEQTYRSR